MAFTTSSNGSSTGHLVGTPQRHTDFVWADPWPEPAEQNATDAVNQRWH